MILTHKKIYTIEDIYDLPDGERGELIDGQIYYMVPPSRKHQTIARELFSSINSYIKSKGGSCESFFAPFPVFLNENDTTYVEPDICVICDPAKLNDRGCIGAPDWIIEIVSPGSRRLDYYTKLSLYHVANVREYWIVDPMKQTILVYDMEHDSAPMIYSFTDIVKVNIYDDLSIPFSELDFEI